MKHLTLLLTIAALAGAASTDSLAFARFRADTAIAGQLWRQAAHQDSAADPGRIHAQTIYQLAVQHLAQDTARKAP
jgi:hypothetical protein